MCFSASASFSLGTVLTVIGFSAIKKVREKKQFTFALIPVLFGLQQITEGMLWLSLKNPEAVLLKNYSTLVFLFFAQVIWPFWVPYSIFKMQAGTGWSPFQKLLLIIGVLLSLLLFYCLLFFKVEASIVENHISYSQYYPNGYRLIIGLMYLSVVVLPPFFSKVKLLWLLGPGVLVSYLLSALFYKEFVISVWCFFAAGISLFILLLIHLQNPHTTEKNKQLIQPEG